MARRQNELFIGSQYLNIDGRAIKHPALIKVYATINVNKTTDEPIKLLGLDLETNHKTAELKLLGFWNGEKYQHYYDENFIETLFTMVRYCDKKERSIAYWNRLDPFVLFKLFLDQVDEKERLKALFRFSKIGGEWNQEEHTWELNPVIEIDIPPYKFGIRNAIRSSIQFFFYKQGDEQIRTVWAYDIAQLYQNGLEKEAEKHLSYYSKVDKSAHLVDWERFEMDPTYRTLVLTSNELDARAVYDLGLIIQDMFKDAFGVFPRNLISQGSLARSAIIAVIRKMSGEDDQKFIDDVQSIGFINYYDQWLKKYGETHLKDMYALFMEAYSGGQIEAYAYGYVKEAYTADLASAYPAIIEKLFDLRNAEITFGDGEPPVIEHSYCFVRGLVHIPHDADYHPLTVKHPIHKETNIRPTGDFYASYIKEERDYMLTLGATFEDETWVNIATTGELSPLAKVCKTFTDLRAELIERGSSAQYVAKTSAASLYGILYEAVDTYEEAETEITRSGYRAGEFFNPIFATYITALTRIKIARACYEIKKAGGHPYLVMTDSVFFGGSADMIPADMIREKKTVGYFEPPQKINDFVCLGSGRYGYMTEKGFMQSKKRGLNATEIHDENGIILDDFNWLQALNVVERTHDEKIRITVRALVSVGMVLHNSNYQWVDLGKVVEEDREVDLIVGKSKRMYDEELKDPAVLSHGMIETSPLYLVKGMNGLDQYQDQTLKQLRELLMMMKCESKETKIRQWNKKAVDNYRAKNKKKTNTKLSSNYKQLLEHGYNAKEATKMKHWSMDKITDQLRKDKKI